MRDYDPSLGRYIQADPSGFRGGLNLFGYAAQNPTQWVDPMGLEERDPPWENPEHKLLEGGGGVELGEYVEPSGPLFGGRLGGAVEKALNWLFGESAATAEAEAASAQGVDVNAKALQAADDQQCVLCDLQQLQSKYKHAGDFGVTGNYNSDNAQAFGDAIEQHVNSQDVQEIDGTYRGNPVTFFLNPNTGLNVITDTNGNFISGWKLSPDQFNYVLTTGKLGGD